MYRIPGRVILCMLLTIACAYTSNAQCPAATPLVINSVTPAESRCQASGTATVSASGGSTPYTYSIIAGPSLASPQSSNVLKSLTPGTYTVQVTDNCNTSVTQNVTITGTYTVPVVSIVPNMPTCPGSNDGSITINASSGRAPLKYALISPSPVIVSPQAGNVFTSLPVGTYYCQVSDSCGNFQTQKVVLSAVSSVTVYYSSGSMQYVSCDSFDVYLTINISNYKPPYTITATQPDGTVVTQVLTAPVVNAGNIQVTLPIHYHHVTGATETMPVTVTNLCGVSSTATVDLSTNMDMTANNVGGSTCTNGLVYTFDPEPQLHCSTVTYTLVNPSGVVVGTQTNNSQFTGYPPGTGYQVIRQDCCRKDTLPFDWAAAPPFQITFLQNSPYASCKEGLTTLNIGYNYNDVADVVIVSGPPSVTLADGTVYNYTYPDTAYNVWNDDLISFFGPGTYKLVVTDIGCGQQDSTTLTFGPADMRHTVVGATLEKGCNNANKILLNVNNNDWWEDGELSVNSSAGQVYDQQVESSNTSFSDSIQNLPADTYYATYQYQTIYGFDNFRDMNTWGCDLVYDTVVIPPYANPTFSSSAAVALCGATRQVALLPDTTTGVSPYEYSIISGPVTAPLQTSPVFPGLSAGTYTFQMVDACANSYSHSISIDTLAVPAVVTTGNTCLGGAATFTLPASPFYNYSWQLPNGGTSTGNTLALNPVSSSDIGSYTVSLTSSIGGCTNSVSKSYNLNTCQVLAETLLHFNGQWKNGDIQLSWQMANGVDVSYYLVERSTDGVVFTPVQQVAATTLDTYSATDTHVPGGVVYYRLKMTETSGAISYSSIISFNSVTSQPFTVYPSLITGRTTVTVTYPGSGQGSFIRVVGVDGKIWQNVAVAAGTTTTSIEVSYLARGVYFVVFNGGEQVMATQVWKE